MKFLNFIKTKFTPGDVYAVHKGTYLGYLLVYVEYNKQADLYCFLSIKDLNNIFIPSKDIKQGIESSLLRKTDLKLPKKLRTLCFKQYKFNIDNPKSQPTIEEDENFDTGLQ